MSYKEVSGQLSAAGMKFGIVVSRFNSIFTQQLLKGALDCIVRHGGSEEQVTVVWVPGANELPLVVDQLAARGGQDAIIALGAVIQGATDHADLINAQVSRSLAQTGLARGVPVLNAVVCANNLEQAVERSGSKAGNKGWDGALAAIEMASVFKKLKK
ncbi:MAG: 6,7-dimethyl-8-ribityllumazine synthase [bacterium]